MIGLTIRGDLNVTQPVGGEKWGVAGGVSGAFQTISWQRNGSTAQVYLDYSKSGATGPWIPILNATAGLEHTNSGSIAWDIANDMTTNAFIRVRNVAGPAVEDKSPAAFKIMARFDLTAPDGGEIATAGQNFDIRWNKWGSLATNVKLELAIFGADGEANRTSPILQRRSAEACGDRVHRKFRRICIVAGNIIECRRLAGR